jgi:hypothetical protein
MPNRIIKESICTSDTVDQLKSDEECFFYRLMVNCDDYGRMDARPSILLAKCFPLRVESLKAKDVQKMLNTLIKHRLIFVYGEGKYLQMVTWDKHQQIRAKRSKYPHPTEDDINGYQMISDDCICPRNPIQSESESESNPNPIIFNNTYIDSFDSFWKEYPKKEAKKDAVKAWNKIKLTDDLLINIMDGLKKAIKSTNWVKQGGQFIPNAATWLNGERWNDEVEEAQTDLFPKNKQCRGNNQMDIITELMEEYRGDGQRNSVEDPDTIDISLS